jgi:hypothetical protein
MSQKDEAELEAEIEDIRSLPINEIRALWRHTFKSHPPVALGKDMLGRMIAYHIQEKALGRLSRASLRLLDDFERGKSALETAHRRLKPGTDLVRVYQGERHSVVVASDGFVWRAETYASLSTIARLITCTNWNGPKFFGLRPSGNKTDETEDSIRSPTRRRKRRQR